MKKTRNRVLSLLLTVCMVITMLPTAAFAAEETTTHSVTVVGENSKVEVIGEKSQTVTAGEKMTGIKMKATTKGHTVPAGLVTISGDGVNDIAMVNGGIVGTPTGDVTITINSGETTPGRVLIWTTQLDTTLDNGGVANNIVKAKAASDMEAVYSQIGCKVTNDALTSTTNQHFDSSENLAKSYDMVLSFCRTPN